MSRTKKGWEIFFLGPSNQNIVTYNGVPVGLLNGAVVEEKGPEKKLWMNTEHFKQYSMTDEQFADMIDEEMKAKNSEG